MRDTRRTWLPASTPRRRTRTSLTLRLLNRKRDSLMGPPCRNPQTILASTIRSKRRARDLKRLQRERGPGDKSWLLPTMTSARRQSTRPGAPPSNNSDTTNRNSSGRPRTGLQRRGSVPPPPDRDPQTHKTELEACTTDLEQHSNSQKTHSSPLLPSHEMQACSSTRTPSHPEKKRPASLITRAVNGLIMRAVSPICCPSQICATSLGGDKLRLRSACPLQELGRMTGADRKRRACIDDR